MGFGMWLLLAFIVLKLIGAIHWSWWIVLWPLWLLILCWLILLATDGSK